MELKKLLLDPKRYFYEVGHKIPPPYLKDPLEENASLAAFEKKRLVERLYFEEPLLPLYLPSMVKEDLTIFLEASKKKIEEQLTFFALKKEELFSVAVQENIQAPTFLGKNYFFPQNRLKGAIPIATESGILIPKEKSKTAFIEALVSLLLLYDVQSPLSLTAYFFEETSFSISSLEAEKIFSLIDPLLSIAKKQPLEWYFKEGIDRYQIYQSITPFFEEEIDEEPVRALETFLKEIYARL